jgi:hypothetical protein
MPEIKNYAIRIHGGPTGEGHAIRAQVHLFDAHNHLMGAIDFFDAGHALPVDQRTDLIRMALHIEQLPAVVDMLRHESPVFLAWQERLKNAYLGTSQEPVGEGERH